MSYKPLLSKHVAHSNMFLMKSLKPNRLTQTRGQKQPTPKNKQQKQNALNTKTEGAPRKDGPGSHSPGKDPSFAWRERGEGEFFWIFRDFGLLSFIGFGLQDLRLGDFDLVAFRFGVCHWEFTNDSPHGNGRGV